MFHKKRLMFRQDSFGVLDFEIEKSFRLSLSKRKDVEEE